MAGVNRETVAYFNNKCFPLSLVLVIELSLLYRPSRGRLVCLEKLPVLLEYCYYKVDHQGCLTKRVPAICCFVSAGSLLRRGTGVHVACLSCSYVLSSFERPYVVLYLCFE